MNLFELGKLLIIQEESSISGLKASIDNLNENIANQGKQAITAPTSTSAVEGKVKYFTENKENYITSGTLFSTEKDITFKLFKFETSSEWKNLSIYINKELYMSGDYAYFDTIGLAYFNSNKNSYVFHLEDEQFKDGIKITVDSGMLIYNINIIGKIAD